MFVSLFIAACNTSFVSISLIKWQCSSQAPSEN